MYHRISDYNEKGTSAKPPPKTNKQTSKEQTNNIYSENKQIRDYSENGTSPKFSKKTTNKQTTKKQTNNNLWSKKQATKETTR